MVKKEGKHTFWLIVSAIMVAVNMNTFVDVAGLYPGGFSGIALLVQRIGANFWGVHIPFSLVSYSLNIVVLLLTYKYVGKRFLIYTCLSVGLVGALTDIMPGLSVTDDVLLASVFGGILNGIAVSLCMLNRGSTGGMDILANVYGQRYNKDPWNYVLGTNCLILLIAGTMFGWDKALYSILFQYASTQVTQLLFNRFQQHTLLIITEKHKEVYQTIKECTNHSVTVLDGTGGYSNEDKKMIYSVVSSQEVKAVLKEIKKVDEHAFINIMKTQQIDGRFVLQGDQMPKTKKKKNLNPPT